MRTTIYPYAEEGYNVEITVSAATLAIGGQRSRLFDQQGELFASCGIEAPDNISLFELRMFVDSTSATVKVTNKKGAKERVPWPLTFEQFRGLPEVLCSGWHDATLELNPHWAPWRRLGSQEGTDQGEAEGGDESQNPSSESKPNSPAA
jgi:hypothetical protein